MIITIANAKGGMGKTTSAMYLAQAAKLRDPDLEVMVLDADPQSSVTQWALDAEGQGVSIGYRVDSASSATLSRLGKCRPSGLILVDTPPSGAALDEACRVADFVIIPTSLTPLDLQQTFKWDRSIKDKPHCVLVLDADLRTLACRATIDALDAEGVARFGAVVCHRQDIVCSFMAAPSKLWECADVWAELVEALSRAFSSDWLPVSWSCSSAGSLPAGCSASCSRGFDRAWTSGPTCG